MTTQRGTVVNVDSDGQPLRPAITWLDQRKNSTLPPISALWRTAFRLAGAAETVRYFQREAEANWIAANQPRDLESNAQVSAALRLFELPA